MITPWDQAQSAIGRLSVHYRGTAAEMKAPALRLRAERLLGSVNLYPAGVSASAVLIVSKLYCQAPLSSQVQFLPADRASCLREQIRTLYATAARPAYGPVSASATSVLFTDPAEMLACLTHDLLTGQAWGCWYWQYVLRNMPQVPSSALTTLWCARAAFVPAALGAMEKAEVYAAIAALSPAQVSAITQALHSAFDLLFPAPAIGADSNLPLSAMLSRRTSSLAVPQVQEAQAATIPASPWQPWLFPAPPAELTPQALYLLGLALTLQQAPAFARSAHFMTQATAWLHAKQASIMQEHHPSYGWEDVSKNVIAVSHNIDRDIAALSPKSMPDDEAEAPSRLVQREEMMSTEAGHNVGAPARGTLFRQPTQISPLEQDTCDHIGHPQEVPLRHQSVKTDWDEGSISASFSADTSAPLYDLRPQQAGDMLPDSELSASALARSMIPSVDRAATGAQFVDRLENKQPAETLDEGLATGLGGVLYLINLLLWLDLPACWDAAWGLAEHIGGWGIVEVLARGLLSSRYDDWVEDAIWSVLASLDGREPGLPIGAILTPQDAFRLPAQWLHRFGSPAPTWSACAYQTRLLLFEESAKYLIVDVPLSARSLEEAVLAEVEAYQAAGVSNITWHASDESHAQISSLLECRAPAGISQSANWWLQRVLGFIQYLLLRALNEDVQNASSLPDLLLLKSGRLLVSRTHVDLSMPMDLVSLSVRRAGLDRDPGWVPDLGRIVLFHFD